MLACISLQHVFAGFAAGFKAGSHGVGQGLEAGEKARYRGMVVRQQRERNRTGIIDVIDLKRRSLVGQRPREIQLGINASIK